MSSDQEAASHMIVVADDICRVEERSFLEAEKPTMALFFFFASSFPAHVLYHNIPFVPAVTVF